MKNFLNFRFFILIGTQVTIAGMNFAIQIFLTRILDIEDYGIIVTLLTSATLVSSIIGFGIYGYWLRVFALHGYEALDSLKSSFKLINWSIICCLIIWLAMYKLLDLNIGFGYYILFFAVLLTQGLQNIVQAIIQLEGNFLKLSRMKFFFGLSKFLPILTCLLFLVNDVRIIITSLTISSIYICFLYTKVFRKFIRREITLEGHLRVEQPGDSEKINIPTSEGVLIKNSLPYFFLGLFYVLYYQSAILLVSSMLGKEYAAIYNVAFVLISVVYIVPTMLFNVFLLPGIHRLKVKDPTNYSLFVKKSTKYSLVLGIIAMSILFLSSEFLVEMLFGNEFIMAVLILQILSFGIPFRLVSNSLSSFFLEESQVWKKVKIQGLAALFNVVLNLIFIHIYGLIGAALISVLTELLVASLFLYKAYPKKGVKLNEIFN